MGMGMNENEGLNVAKSHLNDAFADIKGRLTIITGIIPFESIESEGITWSGIMHPTLLIGKPGIGKTCGLQQIIDELNAVLPDGKKLGFKKILLGQTVVGSMTGIPVVNPSTGEVVRAQMPDLPDPERDGEYGILFLDEITTADEAQIQPALGLADDTRNIGTYTLPKHWYLVAAGNGPDCANFVKLDDMTISRFKVYDIEYDYKQDWREWAHSHNIEPDIIAFLNFAPDTCVRVESTAMDEAGKLFPCPRTWTALSQELKLRRVLGRPVQQNELANFAGRIVGQAAGREYAAFCAFHQSMAFEPEDVLNGKAPKGKPLKKQEFHILMQGIIKIAVQEINADIAKNGTVDIKTAKRVANFMSWVISYETVDFDICLQTFIEVREQSSEIRTVLSDPDFSSLCPEFDVFFQKNSDYIMQNFQNIFKA